MRRPQTNEAEAIGQAVDEVVHSEQLARSPALVELLLYLRDKSKTPGSEPTTEYAIAQDVLGRGADFDPQTDTVVRVRIRRLRDALDAYYRQHPQQQRLYIPNRSYDLPLLKNKNVGGMRLNRLSFAIGTTLVAGLVAVLIFFLSSEQEDGYPLIRVLPIQNLTDSTSADVFEVGLQRQIASDLQRFGRVRVFVASPPRRDIENADFTLRGSILHIGDEIDVVLRLEREANSSLVFGDRIKARVLSSDYFASLSKIALEISGRIAGKGGPTTAFKEAELSQSSNGLYSRTGIHSRVFRCLVHADHFFENYDVGDFLEAYSCFETLRDKFDDDPFAFSQWATLGFHAVPEFDLMETHLLPPEMHWTAQQTLEAAKEGVERFPSSSDAFLLFGSVQNALGNYHEAELALRQSLNLNPGDPTAHAVMSYFLMANEQFELAIESAKEAIDLSAVPQGYVYLPMTLSALALGDQETAVVAGTAYADKRTGDGATVIELIVARLKDDESTIRRLSPEVAKMQNPLSGFSNFVRGEHLKNVLENLLPEADLSFI